MAKGGKVWGFEYLFAKKAQANIDDDELAEFRHLAKRYEKLTDRQIGGLTGINDFVEICHDGEAQVQ